MKIGDEVFVHGYVDEIRNDVVIIKNEGGYFGTAKEEVADLIRCKDCKYYLLGHDNQFYCFKQDDDILWQDDSFCSFAERKEK